MYKLSFLFYSIPTIPIQKKYYFELLIVEKITAQNKRKTKFALKKGKKIQYKNSNIHRIELRARILNDSIQLE